MTADSILYLILALCGAATLFVALHLLRTNVFNPQGRGMDRKTASKLRGFARLHLGQVLSHVKLPDAPEIENMLIGPFGILMVHTCAARGEYYGRVDGEQWSLMQNGAKTAFPNPLRQQEQAITVLRDLFAKNKVFKVPIEHLVYFTSKSKKNALFISHDGQILTPGALGSHLLKEKYEQDKGVDVPRVVEVIRSAASPVK